jgi:hypothetical protein
VAGDHVRNGVNSSEPKDIIIEPDGPSIVSKDDDDSKVIRLPFWLSRKRSLLFIPTTVYIAQRVQRRRSQIGQRLARRGRHGELQESAAEGAGVTRWPQRDRQRHDHLPHVQGQEPGDGLLRVPRAILFRPARGFAARASGWRPLLAVRAATVSCCTPQISIELSQTHLSSLSPHRTWPHFVIVLPPSLVIALIVFISIAESFPDVSGILIN